MFDIAVLVFGALLMGGALLSGLARRSFLSLTALFVLCGFVLGEGGLEVLELDAGGGFVQALAIVALIVILFRDGLEVEAEMLQAEWRLPLRKLVLAMPITAAIVAGRGARADRSRLGASACCSARCSPRPIPCSRRAWSRTRACRASCATRSTSSPGSTTGSRCPRCSPSRPPCGSARTTSCGGSSCSRTSRSASRSASRWATSPAGCCRARGSIPDHQVSLFALGTAFATYGVAVGLPPEGNGADRRVRLRDHARHPAAGPARDVRGARRRHRRDRQARRVRRLRRAADARRAVRRRPRRGGDRRRHAARRAAGRDRGSRCSEPACPRAGSRSWPGSARRAWRR